MADLPKNLQFLSRGSRSVSELCRELNINRQQFARYLNGASKPSQFNVTRIADHFGLSVPILHLPHSEFVELHKKTVNNLKATRSNPISEALNTAAEPLEQIERFIGYYYSYLRSPTEPSKVLKSLVHFHIDGGQFLSKWEEYFTRSADGSSQESRYEGIIRLLNGYLFIVDIETSGRQTILETILRVPHRRKTKVFAGLTMGMTTGGNRVPFASITAFQFLGKRIDWASKRKECGFHQMSSKFVDPVVRNVFAQQNVAHIYPKVFEQL